MFIQIFSVLGIIIILVHSLVFFIFPKTYLETRKEKIYNIANEISSNMNGKEIKYIDDSGEIKTVSYFTMYADDHTHLDKIVYTYKNLYSYDYIYYKKI